MIHTASWVSLGPDRQRISRAVNVDATRHLLDEAAAMGVERFVYTSSLYTLATGTREQPADEFEPWNLHRVDSPYARTKREAEQMVRASNAMQPGFSTIVLCPGMVQGARDTKPTSTIIVKTYSRTSVALVPPGGIPIIDAEVLALAHRRALICGAGGERYAVVGPYLSYQEIGELVQAASGRPRLLIPVSEPLESLVVSGAAILGPLLRRWWPDISRSLAAGGFLSLYVSGDRADATFHLKHPPAIESIRRSL